MGHNAGQSAVRHVYDGIDEAEEDVSNPGVPDLSVVSGGGGDKRDDQAEAHKWCPEQDVRAEASPAGLSAFR